MSSYDTLIKKIEKKMPELHCFTKKLTNNMSTNLTSFNNKLNDTLCEMNKSAQFRLNNFGAFYQLLKIVENVDSEPVFIFDNDRFSILGVDSMQSSLSYVKIPIKIFLNYSVFVDDKVSSKFDLRRFLKFANNLLEFNKIQFDSSIDVSVDQNNRTISFEITNNANEIITYKTYVLHDNKTTMSLPLLTNFDYSVTCNATSLFNFCKVLEGCNEYYVNITCNPNRFTIETETMLNTFQTNDSFNINTLGNFDETITQHFVLKDFISNLTNFSDNNKSCELYIKNNYPIFLKYHNELGSLFIGIQNKQY